MKATIFSNGKLAVLALFATQFTYLTLAVPTVEQPAAVEKRVLPVLMGLAKSFGALAASTLTSTGATAISVNCGVWPVTSVTGFHLELVAEP
jgi:hypothetical protein